MAELVSVIIPVYNAAKFVKASVESILNQTYSDLEIVIVNDGSTDATTAVLNTLSDPRIRIIHRDNAGVANALNMALDDSRGKYIARQDADDISMPRRIQLLVEFLENNPEYGLVGGQAQIIDAADNRKGLLHHATGNAQLKYELLWDSPFVSSTTLFRSECITMLGDFYAGKDRFEDYDMWSRIAQRYKIANLPDVLLDYRELATGLSFTTSNTAERVVNQRRNNISSAFPTMEKNLLEALVFCGMKRSGRFSLTEIRNLYSSIVSYFESMGASASELAEIKSDLAERINTLRWITGENKNVFYYVGRLIEKLLYPKR